MLATRLKNELRLDLDGPGGLLSKMQTQIFKIAGPDLTDYRDCNVYLIAADGLVMIDSGFGANPEALVDNIRDAGCDPADLKAVVLTHCHMDHIRGAAWFREHYGAPIIMHELDAKVVERGDNRLTAAFCFEVHFEPLSVDGKLTGEEGSLDVGGGEIRWLHTPGHSAGSIAIYMDSGGSRILFGQDIGAPLLTDFECDPAAWFVSMEKLLALEADVLCDGHSGVYQPRKSVRRYIEHFVKLRRQEFPDYYHP
jgi:glyoxylase-like metal-dependent hydrolase (beta-lactamase superfamily II)